MRRAGGPQQVGVRTLHIEHRENGCSESLNGRLRDELLNVEISYTLLEAKILIERWRQICDAAPQLTGLLTARHWRPWACRSLLEGLENGPEITPRLNIATIHGPAQGGLPMQTRTQSDLVDRFLAAHTRIEKFLRRALVVDKEKSFSFLVKEYWRRNRNCGCHNLGMGCQDHRSLSRRQWCSRYQAKSTSS